MALRPVTPVGILAATLERVAAQAEGLADAPAGLREDVDRALALARGLDPYLERCTSPESPALAALDARTLAEPWGREESPTGLEPEMLSGHVEGQLLKVLVHATGARRVLELGLFTGYSALAMAEALPDGGELVACEVDPHAAAVAREALDASPDGAKVRIELAPALDTIGRLAGDGAEPFDLVFLDADKPGYAAYLDALLDGGLLAPRGLIAVDNTLMQGEPWLPEAERSRNGAAIAAFNERVAADVRVEQVLVPLRDGITLIRLAP